MDGVPIQEAAQRLVITVEAVRKRARRGLLEAHKVGNGWYIVLPEDIPDIPASAGPATPVVSDELIQEIIRTQKELDFIRQQLEVKDAQIAAKDAQLE